MRLFFKFLLCFSIFQGCTTVQRDCKVFKTGTFEFNYTIDGQSKTGRFVRTKTLNINYYDGIIDSSSVRWINDCEFILQKINPKTTAEKNAIHMKILSTTEDSYTFEYKFAIKKPNKVLQIERGVAKKVKNLY